MFWLASEQEEHFVVDTGATTRTAGNTAAQWKFARETTHRKKLKFHVLSIENMALWTQIGIELSRERLMKNLFRLSIYLGSLRTVW